MQCYYDLNDDIYVVDEGDFEKLLGRKLPPRERNAKESFTQESSLHDIKDTFIGKKIYAAVEGGSNSNLLNPEEHDDKESAVTTTGEVPIKVVTMFSSFMGTPLPNYAIDAIVALANKKYLRGLYWFIKK